MPELTREIFVDIWNAAKAGQQNPDEGLARIQKFMMMHQDLHAHLDRIAAHPNEPVEVEGENLMLHIAMDAATEQMLEADDPVGVRQLMQNLIDQKLEPGRAFHVLSQAMTHEFLTAARAGKEMDKQRFLTRATSYAEQAAKMEAGDVQNPPRP
jgi:hypothetical protein